MTTLVVMAKAPVAGRAKTRLCPPCTPAQAAALAEAALRDTLATAAATPARRRVLALDGLLGPWQHPAFDVIAQRGRGLGDRLEAALDDVGGPVVLIGMDTPQLRPDELEEVVGRLEEPGNDAVFGLAADGGWWTIGLRRRQPGLFDGVAMSTPTTGADQLARMQRGGLKVELVAGQRDVDTWPDAVAVAGAAPETRFAQAVDRVGFPMPASAV